MGHLINPTGYRVGYFSNWYDLWVTSNNLVYAEILHSNVSFRKVLGCFFENFTTDKFSIMYSHFTVEMTGLKKLWVKVYFYDGIVEQKIAHLASQIKFFRKKKFKYFKKRLHRHFFKIRPIRRLKVGLLMRLRFYDFLLARCIIFFFIHLLNFGRPNMEPLMKKRISSFFYRVFHKWWLKALAKWPNFTVFKFVRYYINFLVMQSFSRGLKTTKRFHAFKRPSSFGSFLYALEQALFFWWQRQHKLWGVFLLENMAPNVKFKKFVNLFSRVHRFAADFFTYFYRLYLLMFRQPKFFRFILLLVQISFVPLRLLDTKVECFGLDNNTITASFLARYIRRKIEMRFTIRELFSPISKEMRFLRRSTAYVLGYKFQFVGRLTRRGKVRTTWRLGGSIPTSTVTAQLEHSMDIGILRNGLACVRVWLYRHKSFPSYNHNFTYRLKTWK